MEREKLERVLGCGGLLAGERMSFSTAQTAAQERERDWRSRRTTCDTSQKHYIHPENLSLR
jgi:hypothetical protein